MSSVKVDSCGECIQSKQSTLLLYVHSVSSIVVLNDTDNARLLHVVEVAPARALRAVEV